MLKHLGRKVLISTTCFEIHQKITWADEGGEEYMDGNLTEAGVIKC